MKNQKCRQLIVKESVFVTTELDKIAKQAIGTYELKPKIEEDFC